MLLNALLVVNDERIRITGYVEAVLAELLAAVGEQGLEGVIRNFSGCARRTCVV
jgi:hypothetical protein